MTGCDPIVTSCSTPCTRVIPVGLPERSFVAKFPSVATTVGRISSSWRKRCGSQAAISSGCGSRFPGGRHLRTLAMKTSSRAIPISVRSFSSSLPAAPTNGTPCWSSWNPGASPTNISSASGWPEPKTACVRVEWSGQRVQQATSSASSRSALARATASVTAATAPAATTASGTAEAWLRGGAVSGEHGELLPHVRGAAVGARRLLVAPDELLEVRLALHAHVLVDRHRLGSLGRSPDGPQIWSNEPVWDRLASRLEGRIVVLEPLRRDHQAGLLAAAADQPLRRFLGTDDAWPEVRTSLEPRLATKPGR